MYKNKSILAVIPARGGSKGLPNKNIRMFSGKPLISWTILEARKSRYVDRLILSSDDMGIIKMAKKHGCKAPFIRPARLSGDSARTVDVALHAIKQLEGYDYMLLLQPTSPLRSVLDIDSCIKKCIDNNAKSCVSVYKPKINPYWMYRVTAESYLRTFVRGGRYFFRRQLLPEIYALNGAVYCAATSWLVKNRSFIGPETLAFIMPEERSLDVDTILDFEVGQALLEINKKRNKYGSSK